MTAWVQPAHEKPSMDFVTGGERLKVYSGGYVARVHEGLKEVYETMHHLLDEESFIELTERYAEHYPSHTYNLSLVGEHLPALLHQAPIKNRPYLEDLARLEWALAEAFHAFDDPPFHQSQLAKIPLEDWENARLIFQSSAHLLACEWSVLDLWKNRHKLETEPKVIKKKEYLLIGRRGIQVRCEILDPKQYQLLENLFAGKTLGEACEALADASESETEDIPVAAWFARWVQDGLVARCEIAGKILPS